MFERNRKVTVRSDPADAIVFQAKNLDIFCIAQTCGTFRQGIEHCLQITRRLGNHAQDFARRRLLLRALANFLRLHGDRLL